MTIKEAILNVLEAEPRACSANEIFQSICANKLYDFDKGKTPSATVQALCGDFIRRNDSRVKRTKVGGGYLYYYSKYEVQVLAALEGLPGEVKGVSASQKRSKEPRKSWVERDLHPLLCTWLNSASDDSFTKTIRHEVSSTKDDGSQNWVHPDMVNLRLRLPNDSACQALHGLLNKSDSVILSSYELKRDIHSDYELKRYFFQAVSNSSWANYGWLVAVEIDENKLREEMERLTQTFGIGIIKLSTDAFSSKVLYPAKFRPLDFRTIDKLCGINSDMRDFIDHVVRLIDAQKRYVDSTKAAFRQFCDYSMSGDEEVEHYCKNTGIPYEVED